MPAIKNFSAWVEVDGRKLPEFKVEYSQDGGRTTCWIPSEAGKRFKIFYKDSYQDISTATRLTIDGVRCQGKISYARSNGGNHKHIVTHHGMSMSKNMIQPYVFSNCRLVEDELDHLSGNISALGEIVLSVSEVLIGGRIPSRQRNGFPQLQVYERAKKGIVHGTQLGEPELHRHKPARSTKRVREIGMFVFRYRPIDTLMANDIAPLLQTPTPSPSKPHCAPMATSKVFIDLTLDDEDDETERPAKKRVKREIKPERPLLFDGSVIDLTI